MPVFMLKGSLQGGSCCRELYFVGIKLKHLPQQLLHLLMCTSYFLINKILLPTKWSTLHRISVEDLKTKHEPTCELLLTTIMPERSYEEREEYFVYDEWSFIADVGGYMGLLLGYSLLSLCNYIDFFLMKIYKRVCSKK